MSELVWFPGTLEQPSGPDPDAVTQLWQQGVPALVIATRLGCRLEEVAVVLEQLESGKD